MQAEPLHGSSASTPYWSGASEEAVQVLCELLSAGRPISEVLDAAKRFASLDKGSESGLGGGPARTQLDGVAGQSPGAVAQGGTAQLTEPVESNLAISANPLAPIAGSRSLIVLSGRQSLEAGRVEKRKLSRPIGAALFWLIPAMSLTVVWTTGKGLFDADLLRNNAGTTAEVVSTPEASRVLPPITPGQFEPGRSAEPTVAGSPAEPGIEVGTTAPAALSLRPVTDRLKPAQPRHTRIQRRWGHPRRLTDGF
jgi:hypothetical protein